jgi:hypothetical protein
MRDWFWELWWVDLIVEAVRWVWAGIASIFAELREERQRRKARKRRVGRGPNGVS